MAPNPAHPPGATPIDLATELLRVATQAGLIKGFSAGDVFQPLDGMCTAIREIEAGNPAVAGSTVDIMKKMIENGAVTDVQALPGQITRLASALSGVVVSAPRVAPTVLARQPASAPAQPAQPAVPAQPAARPLHGVALASAKAKAERDAAPAAQQTAAKPLRGVALASANAKAARDAAAAKAGAQKAPVAAAPVQAVVEKPKLRGIALASANAKAAREAAQQTEIELEDTAPVAVHAGAEQESAESNPHLRPISETGQKPFVDPRTSIQKDYIICLEDGRKMKMLKRHLRTAYRMTPEQYRTKWGLPPAYPMTAPNYAKQKSRYAKSIGLGSSEMRAAVTAKQEAF